MISSHDTTTEEYIEVIHALEKENKVARVKDIADRRGVTRSSVSLVMNQLVKKELVSHEQYGHVTLTTLGRQLAKDLEKTHRIIKDWLVNILDVEPEKAEQEACKLEHIISRESLNSMANFLNFIKKCPHNWQIIFTHFKNCGQYGNGVLGCNDCLNKHHPSFKDRQVDEHFTG